VSFSVQQYISKLSIDLQNGLITLEQANDLATKARSLANNRGELGANDRVALRYGVGKSGARTPTSGGGNGFGDEGNIVVPTPEIEPVDTFEDPEPTPAPPDTSVRDAERRMAREEFQSVLINMGFTTDFGFTQQEINQLFGSIDSWLADGWADGMDGGEKLLMKFRTSTETKAIYAKRFGGMAELASRGMAISEGEYIDLERSYRNVMSNYGLPTSYYDSFDDYARLIGAGLSVNEVEQRVVAAKQSMNPLVAAELKEYYNITDGDLTAYMLGLTDEKGLTLAAARNQEQIRTEGRMAQIGAAAERAGFSMNREQTGRLAGMSVGQTIDPFDMRTLSRLEGEFGQARRIADRETTLAGIDRETFDQRDALAAAFGDEQAKLASERRGKRERARFSGSSGAASGSLAVERNL